MRTAWASLPALLSISVCCGPAPALENDAGPLKIVATRVPAGASAPAGPDRPDQDARYPEGSRVVVIQPGASAARNLSDGFVAAGAPAVSFDGTAVLFAGKRAADAVWAIYETDVRNLRRRTVFERTDDCTDPAPLAAGGVVASCVEGGTWSLYVAARSETTPRRITFGPGSAFDPTALEDGRILFSMWHGPGPGRPAEGSAALFTINPDGTLFAPFSGHHEPPSMKRRPRPTWDDGVVYLTADRGGGEPQVERVEMRGPLSTRSVIALRVSTNAGTSTTLAPSAVEPLPDGGLLIAGRPTTDTHSGGGGIYRATRDGSRLEKLADSADWDEVEAVALLPTPTPRGRPSSVDMTQTTGGLVCYDSNRSDHEIGPAADAHQAVSVELEEWTAPSEPASRRLLGRVVLDDDGSFYVEVPADRPIRVLSLDARDEPVARSAWFWVRPGETRACFGCHESRESAPVNRAVLALAHEPERFTSAPSGSLP